MSEMGQTRPSGISAPRPLKPRKRNSKWHSVKSQLCQQQTFNGERGARCLAEVTVLAPGQLLGEAPQRAVHNPPVAAKALSVKNVDLRSAHELPLEARVLRRYARDEPETRR